MKFQNKGAVLEQIAPLFICQPRNQNQSILTGFGYGYCGYCTVIVAEN